MPESVREEAEPLNTAPEEAAVLVVDDKPANLDAIEAVLETTGVPLVRAGSAFDALEAVRNRQFAVIVLDVQLPGMDGYEVARRIKELEEPRLTPIIFVTALDQDRRHVSAGYESGAVDYLFKPLDPDVLRGKVQAFVRLFREREEAAWRQRRRYADLAERTAAERSAEILESIADAFYAVDAEFRFTYVNRRAEEWWGRTRGELLGRSYWTEFPQAEGSEWQRMHLRLMQERQPLHFETISPILRRWVEVNLYPEASGGLSCYFQDISDRKRAETERERLLTAERAARAEADAANRAKSEFLATMSHEFRTPLNALIGYVDLLDLEVAGPLTAQQRTYLTRLHVSARHLLGLVNDVLDIAKTDAGQSVVASEHAHTGEAVAAAMALAAPQAATRGIALVDERDGDAGEPYVGDPGRVRQILLNLLGNAVKFTEHGGRVTIGCGRVAQPPAGTTLHGPGPWTYIRVSDTGVGIPDAEQAAIFEPFHQVERGHTRTRGGTGLGLAISRRFARLMRGDLTVASMVGMGSVFTLWLPSADERKAARSAHDGTTANIDYHVRGLDEVGGMLREEQERVLASYGARLRTDPLTPRAHEMATPAIEDHQLSLLGDLAQTLLIIAEAGPDASDLMKDGSAIQRVVAEHHGRRRCAQGWTEAALRRDYEILRDEVEHVVRSRIPAGHHELSDALRVLVWLLDRARENGLAAFRQAEQHA